jgi:hypothetical protein
MSKVLIYITQPEEWNQLLPFNSFINESKTDGSKVIGITQYNGYIVLSSVDEIITVKNGDFFSYPSVLDSASRENDLFLEKCINYCTEKYGIDNIEIRSWQKTEYDDGVVDVFSPRNTYTTSLDYAKKFFDNGLTIKPTEKVFKSIKKKYGHLFTDKTFILITRNFKNKSTEHNTLSSLPHLEKLLNKLISNGYNIINIGFPPQSYNITENYLEIDESLTQDELISLFYLSRGVLTAADAGGFITHYGSNVDFYVLNEEWSVTNTEINVSLIDSKKTNLTFKLVGLSDDEILDIIIKNNRPQTLEFSEPKKITII